MRRPVVLWVVVVFGGLSAVLNLLGLVGAFTFLGQRPLPEVLGQVLVTLVIVVASGFVAVSLLRKAIQSKLPVSLYLWFMLIVYPLCNVLRGFGLYLPAPIYTPTELGPAAVIEISRYLVILVLIVWVGFSKSLRSHLTDRTLGEGQQLDDVRHG